jgi:hypothetical protein
MAIDKVSLANQALLEVGAGAITSLSEDSEQAFIVSMLFDQLLDEELQRDDWAFATTRAELPALTEEPAFGWLYQHQMPANPYCLRLLSIDSDLYEDEPDHVVEGRKILCDSTPLRIRYIYRVEDMNELSAGFRRAFVFRLAAALAIPIRGSGDLRDRMQAQYERYVAVAASKDAQQSTPPDIDDGSWIDAREGL